MFSTYHKDDVTILLKDITGKLDPLPTAEREKLIQSGRHYSEMLPLEYEPSEKYLKAYFDALSRYAEITAHAAASLAEKIYEEKGASAALVSLARAGTPIGILLKRYIKRRFGADVAHYTISTLWRTSSRVTRPRLCSLSTAGRARARSRASSQTTRQSFAV